MTTDKSITDSREMLRYIICLIITQWFQFHGLKNWGDLRVTSGFLTVRAM